MKVSLRDLQPITFSAPDCALELQRFKRMLDRHPELSEGKHILPFFKKSGNLSALIGTLNPYVASFGSLAYEFDLFGDFACDLVVGDQTRRAYTLLEFEDATRNTMFCKRTKFTHEWGRRYEHGFSQLVDWFWCLNEQRQTPAFRDRFGSNDVKFTGMLVLGRNSFLSDRGRRRLDWRSSRVLIDSNTITCMTFDDLYTFLREKLTSFELAGRSNAKSGALPKVVRSARVSRKSR